MPVSLATKPSVRLSLTACVRLLTVMFLALCGTAVAGNLSIVNDSAESSAGRAPESGYSVPPRNGPGSNGRSREATPPGGTEAGDVQQSRIARISAMQALDPLVREETLLALNVVQQLDISAAAQWLGGFISQKPFNCPLREQRQWVRAIISAAERNEIPLCKEVLGLTACIVCIESGFRADPIAVDPSRGETMVGLVDRAEKELYHKFGAVMAVPPVPQLYAAYREKYLPRLLACKTEGEIEVTARELADDLKKNSAGFPEAVRTIVDREIDKVANVVRTKGSMQLNFLRARQMMKERGEEFTDRELTDYMYTVDGGVDVGVAALKPMFIQYAARYATPGNLSWLFFAGMDYHYGPFSSRNMMEQIRIRDLSGRKLAIDGDLLRYDEKGRPEHKDSETLRATMTLFPDRSRDFVYGAFLLEKDAHYIYTELHKAMAKAHVRQFGETPFAVIGEMWMGEEAQVKHGAMWKTRAYLKKLDRYLNAVPWDS